MSKENLLVRLFSAIWGGVDGVRKVLHLVLLLFVFLLFFGAMQDTPLALPDRARSRHSSLRIPGGADRR